ncbi:MAG TPA: ATP-binding protein [Candidatus Binatia bacterium]|nr:ATP-binding protein [Candidatus Binatia bacterium]
MKFAPWKWSLRRQIGVLGLMVLVTVFLATALALQGLRQTEAARVADALRQLDRARSQLVDRYEYLRGSVHERQTANPLRSGDDQILRALTETTLAGVPSVEGGFFSTENGRLLGYAYPTYQGTGPKTDIPVAERSTIQRVVETAIATKGVAEEQIAVGTDGILFCAQALLEGEQPVGAVWLMQRLSDLHGTHRKLYSMGLIGLLMVSSTIALGAWFLTRRLDYGVSAIEMGLRAMEERLEDSIPATNLPELDRIGLAINRLARALQENQTRRAELEQRLRQADRLAVLGRLVAGVAHEVRNPLASIKLKLHLARNGSADPDRLASAFDVVQAEVDRMNRLVERLLALAKPSEPVLLPTDLSYFLAERLEFWKARAATQGTTLEFLPVTSVSEPVFVDRDRVGQILDNLLANALDALADQGGRVIVEAERKGPTEIAIVVADTGPGVPPEIAEQIFEPFFTTRNRGTGLGLFLSAEMARRLGGHIDYHPCPGGGARFEVHLPC